MLNPKNGGGNADLRVGAAGLVAEGAGHCAPLELVELWKQRKQRQSYCWEAACVRLRF